MSLIHLVEVTAYDATIPGTRVLRYCTGLGYNHPNAPGFYEPCIRDPGQIARSMFASRTTLGAVAIAKGDILLVNPDGLLDGLIDCGFDGRPLVIKVGEDAAAYSSFVTVFSGTMLPPRFSLQEVQLRLRDRLDELGKPLLTTKFAGTNSLPNGLEGGDDIKGKVKPRAYGVSREVSPPCVNTARLIYQLSDGAVQAVTVYDNAVALTAGAAYSSQADMEANAPAAGQYRLWSSSGGSYIRLGASPVGQITADVTAGATSAARTSAQILKAIAIAAGIPSGDIVAGDVTGLDAASSAETGIWISDEMTAQQAMEAVAPSAGAWFGFDRLGQLRMAQLAAPAGTPVATLKRLTRSQVAESDTIDLLAFELVTGNDGDDGLPAYRVTVEYQRCYTTFPQVLDGTVTAARRTFLSNEYRKVVAEDLTVQTKHPKSPEITIRTPLDVTAAAQAEADRQLAMRKVRRDRATATIRADASVAALIDLGVVVRVQITRFGFSAGKLFRVIGITPRLAVGEIDLELWG
ncbi:hypothetical protein [Roseococcus sp. YIM B11640]|uniref:hypothetical protein n=1 Tax=Roseococcus sp. YIM B11640 TaxID=3133973 RepID=UPI003C7D7ACC